MTSKYGCSMKLGLNKRGLEFGVILKLILFLFLAFLTIYIVYKYILQGLFA